MYPKLSTFLNFDQNWLYLWNNFANSSVFWGGLLKFFGQYLIYILPIFLIIFWFYGAKTKKAGLTAFFSAGLAFAFANIIGRLINRPRPFELGTVHELFFHRPTYSFPSDHAAVLFAVAFALYFVGFRKLFWLMLILAIIISFARIATGVHFPSDVFSGAILGFLAAWVIWLLERPLDYIYNFLILIARKLRLA